MPTDNLREARNQLTRAEYELEDLIEDDDSLKVREAIMRVRLAITALRAAQVTRERNRK